METETQTPSAEKTWEFEGKTFKRCPGCQKAILADWKSHHCGWGKEMVERQAQLPTSFDEDKNQRIREMFESKQGSISRQVAWKTAGEVVSGTSKKTADIDKLETNLLRLAKRGLQFIESGN